MGSRRCQAGLSVENLAGTPIQAHPADGMSALRATVAGGEGVSIRSDLCVPRLIGGGTFTPLRIASAQGARSPAASCTRSWHLAIGSRTTVRPHISQDAGQGTLSSTQHTQWGYTVLSDTLSAMAAPSRPVSGRGPTWSPNQARSTRRSACPTPPCSRRGSTPSIKTSSLNTLPRTNGIEQANERILS